MSMQINDSYSYRRLLTTLAPAAFLALLVCLPAALVVPTACAQIELPSPGETPEVTIVEVTALFSRSSAQMGKTYDAAVVVSVKSGWHINSVEPYQDWLIPADLAFDPITELIIDSIIFPDSYDALLTGETFSVYGGRSVIRFSVTVAADAQPGTYQLPIRFTYQACNDRECRPPETIEMQLSVTVGTEGAPVHGDVFDATVESLPGDVVAESGTTEENYLQRLITEHGFLGYLIALGIAFLSGLLLSFSPCTYPMIPITVSIFAGQKRGIGRGFMLSLLYVGTMAVVYGIMGLIVSLVGGVFGAWLASTPVVIGISIIFVIFALSMFGLYELQVPSSIRQKLGTVSRGGGVMSSIVLGFVAALVVSPCVGPFVAGILLYVATSGSPLVGFLVLFVFAIGLGTLYLIIGTFSSAISNLPGAGGWMESIKKFFGFVLLLMALYFIRTIIPPNMVAVLAGLLLVAFGVFGGGLDRLTPESGFFLRLKKLLGLLALLMGVYLLTGTLIRQGVILPPASQWLAVGENSGARTELIEWETDLEAGLARAMAEGKPVMIDTWATWCVNCRVLDTKTFGNPDVAGEATRFICIKVQLEKADTPISKKFMARFGLKHYSLPTTLLLDSQGRVHRTIKGVIGPREMIAEMRRVS
ncbi:MAG: cytochrome c biogenesis protein CcdA [bacterium]